MDRWSIAARAGVCRRGARRRSDRMAGEEARQRLKIFARTADGFALAEEDARLRGSGQFFGTRQHGLPEFKLADITSEMELLQRAKDDALELLNRDPSLRAKEHQHLRAALQSQIGDALALAQIG